MNILIEFSILLHLNNTPYHVCHEIKRRRVEHAIPTGPFTQQKLEQPEPILNFTEGGKVMRAAVTTRQWSPMALKGRVHIWQIEDWREEGYVDLPAEWQPSLQHEIWSHVTNLLDSKVMVEETDMMWEDLPARRARFPDLRLISHSTKSLNILEFKVSSSFGKKRDNTSTILN